MLLRTNLLMLIIITLLLVFMLVSALVHFNKNANTDSDTHIIAITTHSSYCD